MTLRRYYTITRIFKSGFVNLFRNAWLTVAATAVMVVALTIILFAVILNTTANNAISVLALDLKAEIYLQDGVNEKDLEIFEEELRQLEIVEDVDFISKEEASEIFTAQYQDDEERRGILQALALAGDGADALQASYRISVNDLERMPEIQTFAEDPRYVDIVEDISLGKDKNSAQDTIDKAATGQRYINAGSVLAATVLSAVSVMIIFNTIRMAIYTRRDEIRIMKLIGATPDYIRGPFLVEASLYGVFAGAIANGIVYSLIYTVGDGLKNVKEFSQTYAFFTQPRTMIAMLGAAILVGILIGAVSSMLAMERHLKLKDW